MIYFILGISLVLNLIAIITFIYIYKKIIKNNPLEQLKKMCNIDKDFWDL